MAEEQLGRLPLHQQTIDLHQQTIDQPPRPRRRGCDVCNSLKLEQELVAAAGGQWKCGRGHGVIL